MKFPTSNIKVPINFKRSLEDLNRKKISNGTIKKMSIPKLINKMVKHKDFPIIINDLTMEKCEW